MFKKINRKSKSRESARSGNEYATLENRCLLAVTPSFAGGTLNVALTEAGDTAVLSSTVDSEVLVNGSTVDTDLKTAGIQPALLSDVSNIVFNGDKGLVDLAVSLEGAFADGSLNSITFNNINSVDVAGLYNVGTLDGNFVGSGGSLTGAGTLQADILDIDSTVEFLVNLENTNNDFDVVNIDSNGGAVSLADADEILLQNLSVGELSVEAVGSVTDAIGSTIVAAQTNFAGSNINLGNNGNAVDFLTTAGVTAGNFSVNDVNSLILADFTSAGSANINAAFNLNQGIQSNFVVIGDAFVSANDIRLGTSGANFFNTGRLNVNSTANSFIVENSGIELFGSNTGSSFNLLGFGAITNSAGAVLSVSGITSVQSAVSVSLGNAAGDSFNTNTFEFFAPTVDFSEDSSTTISGFANFATDLNITSNGLITNIPNTFILVESNATFVSSLNGGADPANINIGSQPGDFFSAGTLSFDVANGNFIASEDSGTFIASQDGFVNQANNVGLTSVGAILNGPQSEINIANNITFNAASVEIGVSDEDSVEFGSVTFENVTGDAEIIENGDLLLTGDSNIGGQLIVTAAGGQVEDSGTSQLSVGTLSSFFGQGVTIGDGADDSFTTDTLRFITSGNAEITQNGTIQLEGLLSQAVDVELNALGGDIVSLDNTTFIATGDLVVSSTGNISLGNAANDFIVFDDLNFNTPGSVNIQTDFTVTTNFIVLFGNNTADELTLVTNVDVLDGTNATLIIDSAIFIDAQNIVLGDTDTDCVIVPSVDPANFMTSDQPFDVTPGGDCV